jgi:hypothetical protein
VIAPTTPIGSRTTSELPISSVHGKLAATAAAVADEPIGSPTWTVRENEIGEPISAVIEAAMSPARAFRPSEMRWATAIRSSTGVPDQPGNAARAAATARSTSAAVPAGTVATMEPSAGLTTSMTSRPPATRSPPIQCADVPDPGSTVGVAMPPYKHRRPAATMGRAPGRSFSRRC